MTSQFKKIVRDACKKKSNYFGYGIWTHHIKSVIKYATILAKRLNADSEVVEIAAIFHDYASVVDKKLYPKHHIHSAHLAEKILKKYKYPQPKINRIKECIISHRGSINIEKKTIEEQIVASADAMSHFDHVESLLFLAYTIHKLDIDEGRVWAIQKLDRSWHKLIPEAKKIIAPKRKHILATFKSD